MKSISATTFATESHALKLSQCLLVRVVSEPEEILRFDALLREKHYLARADMKLVRYGRFESGVFFGLRAVFLHPFHPDLFLFVCTRKRCSGVK